MSENLFCAGQKRIGQGYRDGWYRSFVGMPKWTEAAESLIKRYVKKCDYAAALTVLTDKFGFDEDYSIFVIRELAK